MNQQIPTVEDFLAQQDTDEDIVEMGDLQKIAEGVQRLVEHFTSLGQPKTLTETAVELTGGPALDGDAELWKQQAQALTEALHDETSKLQTATQVIADVEAALGKSTAKPSLAAKAVIEAWRNPQVPEPVEEIPDEVSHDVDWQQAAVANPDSLPGHTRAQTGETSPDICQECSYSAQDYVQWPCRPVVDGLGSSKAADALFVPESAAGAQPEQAPVQPAHDAPVEEWRAYARALGFAGPDIDKANRSVIRTTLDIAHEAPAPEDGA